MAKQELEEVAYRSIIRMILEHRFRPGDLLLETELAEHLQLSRTPVRQALARLVAEGFLEKRRKKGCLIPIPDADDARHVFFARETIEAKTAESAARYATDDDLQFFQDLLKKEDAILRAYDREAYTALNEQFHLGLAKAGKNVYLERYCRHIFWRSNLYIFFYGRFYTSREDAPQPHATSPQHSTVIEAIMQRNPEKAGEAMTAHIRDTYRRLFKPWE